MHGSDAPPRSPPRSRAQKCAIVLACLGALLIAVALAGAIGRRNTSSQALVAAIQTHLQQPSDWVRVADIYPGQWTEVCLMESMSTGGSLEPDRLARRFGLQGHVVLPAGAVSVSDDRWALIFYTPPNTLDVLHISNRDLFEYGVIGGHPDEQVPKCRDRDSAVIVAAQRSARGIQLTTLEHLEDRDIK